MDRDRMDHERAIELLTKRNPLTVEQAEDLFRILTSPRDHRIHKAVANYVANDIGLGRKEIETILARAIEARNPGYMVRQEVEKYFKCRPDGTYQAEDAMREAINDEVRRYMKERLDTEAGAYLRSAAHEISGRIFRAAAQEPVPAPAPDGSRPGYTPGLTVYPGAVLVSPDAAASAAQAWMDRNCGTGARAVCMVRSDRPRDPWSVTLPHARLSMGDEAYGRICAMLRKGMPRSIIEGMPIPIDGDWAVPAGIKQEMLAAASGIRVGEYLWHPDGILCLMARDFPPEHDNNNKKDGESA